nr:MAG: capsid polyprotein [Dicistroviridae sp.]QJI52215.1 MAG: hypothetical protein [Dicistroviridae sp.]
MTAREERIHTIKDFLSRPIIIHTDTWSSTTASDTQLFTANFPEVLIANTMYRQKLRGFVGLRATLVVKVQVNSQPFQQGRLMLQYFPYAQYMPNRVALVNSTLQGRSGCPRTDLDLSVGTEIEMRIPYVSPHVYYNLVTGQGSFGAIYLVVYSQLRDQLSGEGAVEYTVWAHLEDVDVQYPTGANIFTGSAPNLISESQKIADGTFTQQDMTKMWHAKTYLRKPDKIFAQMGSELEQLKNRGTISGGIGQISEGLSTLSRIPVLGNIFTRPAWISAASANIFKMLGFSKPTQQGLACESKLRTQVRMANFDGSDTSHRMALSAANEIETKPGLAGTSLDEMDFGRLLSIPNYWDRFTWSTDNATNSILWDNFVTPFKVKPYSDTINDRFRCTHMGYVANTFGYWRGGIVYTFKFVKTQFHSGRLRISFIPFYFNDTISTGVPDVSRTQKVIVDLRTSTEVSFTVPYISSRPWMFCIRPEAAWLGENNEMMYNAVTGIVRVEVLNKLVAANNVFQSIDTLVEVNGAPDLSFAAPTCPSYYPYGGEFTALSTREAKKQHDDEYDNNIVAQMMGEDQQIPRNEAQHGRYPMSIDTHTIDSNWSPEAMCIGEKIMSVRQLIKRFGTFASNFFATSTVANALMITPFSVASPPTSPGASVNIAMLDYYYFIYAFWRGSVRLKHAATFTNTDEIPIQKFSGYWIVNMWNSIQDTMNLFVSSLLVGSPAQNFAQSNNVSAGGQSKQLIDTSIEGAVEYEVPYYNVSHISPATTYAATQKPADIPGMLKGHVPPIIVSAQMQASPQSTAFDVISYRAAGDDYSLMYLVGVPPLANISRA